MNIPTEYIDIYLVRRNEYSFHLARIFVQYLSLYPPLYPYLFSTQISSSKIAKIQNIPTQNRAYFGQNHTIFKSHI